MSLPASGLPQLTLKVVVRKFKMLTISLVCCAFCLGPARSSTSPISSSALPIMRFSVISEVVFILTKILYFQHVLFPMSLQVTFALNTILYEVKLLYQLSF